MNVYSGFGHRFKDAVVVVGSFDGVHRGHRLLIDMLNREADGVDGDAVVVTFDPHPRQVLRGENRLLTTIEERLWLFERSGVRNVVVVNFDSEFAAIDAESFVRDYLCERLGALKVFTGQGHTFGRNRGGEATLYQKYGLSEINIDRIDNISSTLVRGSVENGHMIKAAELLGDSYLVFTPISDLSKILPPSGMYECEVDGEILTFSVDQIRESTIKSKIFIKNRIL